MRNVINLHKNKTYKNTRDLWLIVGVVPITSDIELFGYEYTGTAILIIGVWTGIDLGNIFTSGYYNSLIKQFKNSNKSYNTEYNYTISNILSLISGESPTGHFLIKNDTFVSNNDFDYYTNTNYAIDRPTRKWLNNLINKLTFLVLHPTIQIAWQFVPIGLKNNTYNTGVYISHIFFSNGVIIAWRDIDGL